MKCCGCSDKNGNLFLLKIQKDNELGLFNLGNVNFISCISYIGENKLFLGSDVSNSYLIEITQKENIKNTSNTKANTNSITKNNTNKSNNNNKNIKILEEFENLSPITDFVIINTDNNKKNSNEDNDNNNNNDILCVSGTGKYTKFNYLRKGCDLTEIAEIPYFPCNKFFSVEISEDFFFPFSVNKNPGLYDEDEKKIQYKKNLLIFSSKGNYEFLIFDKNLNEIYRLNKAECPFDIENDMEILLIKNFTKLSENFILLVTNKYLKIFDESNNLKFVVDFKENAIMIKFTNKKLKLFVYDFQNNLSEFDIEKVFTEGKYKFL